jgi:perosamine synthetase
MDTQSPRRISQVDLFIDDAELESLSPSIARRWLTEGPQAAKLAERIKSYTKTKHVLFAPNGTLGLYLALLGLDLPKGSEILLPSFTFYGSAASTVFAGLKPVFVDVYESTYNIDLEDLERKITPETSAIMPVHIYGQSCDIEGVMTIAKRHNLKVIEDAAQSFSVRFNGQHTGTFGDVGVFSFFSDKVVTMGEGSALFTQDDVLFERLRLLRNQGRPNSGTFIHPELGMNFRITDIQASICLAQLEKLEAIRARRAALVAQYRRELEGVADIRFMSVHPKSEFVPFRAAMTSRHREDIQATLLANEIETRGFFYPMHLQPRLKSDPVASLPVSERLNATGLCLPVHAHIRDEDVSRICDVVRHAVRGR